MDDGEVDLSEHVMFHNSDSSDNLQVSASVDSFLDELLRNAQTCTHTHTCNPPGPDAAHSHTCYHTHTHVIPSEKDDDVPDNSTQNSTSKARRPSGNREAVRKYREKKKAHAAYLEEEVKKLRYVNQQLIRKVQRQAILEAEIFRLRGLLLDVRGKIDNELGVLPFQKQCNSSSASKEGDCGVQLSSAAAGLRCEDDLPCFHPQVGSSVQVDSAGVCDKNGISWKRNCLPAVLDCQTNADDSGNAEKCGMESVETLVSTATEAE